MKKTKYFLLVIFVLMFLIKLYPKQPLVIKKLIQPIIFDGMPDEQVWKGILPLPMVMQTPKFGGIPTELTEALLAYDEEYLYIAGRLFDTEPNKIQGPCKKRDSMNPSNEWFGIIIDTFNDKKTAMAFFTTPTGLRFDGLIYNDAEGELPINLDWNTFWEVKTTKNKKGWFVEMRIPLSSLRFEDQDGQVVMGLISWRYIPRKNEMSIFPAISTEFGPYSSWKPSKASEIIFQDVSSRKPFYVSPYLLGGWGLTNELNDMETAYLQDNKTTTTAGLDVKLGLTSNFTMDITLNTDFAQVEADDQQVNLTRFSLFFPEKRLFFQERASIFDFNFGGFDRLFYSRQIGLYEEEEVPIYGGVRLVGRFGDWDIGLLNMQTASIEGLESENFGVLRIKKKIFNRYSYIGGMLTSRIGLDGTYNIGYGLDGIFKVFDDDYLSVNFAQTFDSDIEQSLFSLRPTRMRINWQRRTFKGLIYNLDFSRGGADYRPEMGFEWREDYTRFGNQIGFGWIPGEKSFLINHQALLNGFVVLNNSTGDPESIEIGPGWTFNTKSGSTGNISLKYYFEEILESFELSDDAEVPVGSYNFISVNGFYTTPYGKLINLILTWDLGSFYDGNRLSLGLMPRWNINSTFELSGTYQYNRIKFPERDQSFIAHILRLRLLAMFSTKLSASAFIQYNSAADGLVANFRIRYNPHEGNDLYLVYNEGMNTNRFREMPIMPTTSTRAIMVKYTYTFNFD